MELVLCSESCLHRFQTTMDFILKSCSNVTVTGSQMNHSFLSAVVPLFHFILKPVLMFVRKRCNGSHNSQLGMYLSFGATVQYVFGTAGKTKKCRK